MATGFLSLLFALWSPWAMEQTPSRLLILGTSCWVCARVYHTHKGPMEARSQVEGPGHLPLECPSHHLIAGDGITSWVAALPSSLGSLRLQNLGSFLACLFSHLLFNILWLRALDQESTLQPLVSPLQWLILKFRQAPSLGGPPLPLCKMQGLTRFKMLLRTPRP